MILPLAAALFAATFVPNVPQEAIQCAERALNGVYGELPYWKTYGYQKIKEGDVVRSGYCYITSYGSWESRKMSGGPFASDRSIRLTTDHCAADPAVPFGTMMWGSDWNDEGLRVVRDRGGWVTVRRAKGHAKRNTRNIDFRTKTKDEFAAESGLYVWVGPKP